MIQIPFPHKHRDGWQSFNFTERDAIIKEMWTLEVIISSSYEHLAWDFASYYVSLLMTMLGGFHVIEIAPFEELMC